MPRPLKRTIVSLNKRNFWLVGQPISPHPLAHLGQASIHSMLALLLNVFEAVPFCPFIQWDFPPPLQSRKVVKFCWKRIKNHNFIDWDCCWRNFVASIQASKARKAFISPLSWQRASIWALHSDRVKTKEINAGRCIKYATEATADKQPHRDSSCSFKDAKNR